MKKKKLIEKEVEFINVFNEIFFEKQDLYSKSISIENKEESLIKLKCASVYLEITGILFNLKSDLMSNDYEIKLK